MARKCRFSDRSHQELSFRIKISFSAKLLHVIDFSMLTEGNSPIKMMGVLIVPFRG